MTLLLLPIFHCTRFHIKYTYNLGLLTTQSLSILSRSVVARFDIYLLHVVLFIAVLRIPAIMKLLSTTAALLVFLAPVSTTARSLGIFGSSQSPIQAQGKSVEGDNPLEYCSDPSSDILEIKSVNLTPNPPLPYVLTKSICRRPLVCL
jgi:hypothetical protein